MSESSLALPEPIPRRSFQTAPRSLGLKTPRSTLPLREFADESPIRTVETVLLSSSDALDAELIFNSLAD
jgi:hypothetical protein